MRQEGRVGNVSEVVNKGDKVKVKVKTFNSTNGKTSLSMKDVDQQTGEDLNPDRTRRLNVVDEDDETAARNPDRPSTVPLVQIPDQEEMSVCTVLFFRL